MEYGIMFFASCDFGGPDKYDLLRRASVFADQNGFRCVWTPERHFHEFGSLFSNPAITSAALASITQNLQLRAGSLISPLHDSVRIAEEWSMVDNLSGGRIGISFGSGWNADDFIFFPDRYASRQAVMYEQIATIRAFWKGEPLNRVNGQGKSLEVRLAPKPVQAELPVWVTSSGNAKTFASAGSIGANVLTHLIGQDLETLSDKIRCYRAARHEAGFDAKSGIVTLMLHAFIGPDLDDVRETVRGPFREYIRSAVSLEARAAEAGGAISGGHQIEPHAIASDAMSDLLDITFERYFQTASLMGTPEKCRKLVWQLGEVGVDEIACLIDFGVPADRTMESLRYLAELRAATSGDSPSPVSMAMLEAFTASLDEY